MPEPIITVVYNTSDNDVTYSGSGEAYGFWKIMDTATISGITPDKLVFTGGGINPFLPNNCDYGRREATMRPNSGALVVPQTFVESETDRIMRLVPLAGKNSNRYPMGVYVNGYVASSVYLEAWDTQNFSSTSSEVLVGTNNYPYSMISAVRTTHEAPTSDWHGTTYSGGGSSGSKSECLSGYDHRIKLKDADNVQNEFLSFNIYVLLPSDSSCFHNTPVLSFRYLYI